MDIEKMQSELEEIDAQIIVLADRKSVLRQEIASVLCPFSVGDRVSNGANQYEVCRIGPKGYKPYWELYGAKIKKDGTPGKKNDSCIYSFRGEITKVTK